MRIVSLCLCSWARWSPAAQSSRTRASALQRSSWSTSGSARYGWAGLRQCCHESAALIGTSVGHFGPGERKKAAPIRLQMPCSESFGRRQDTAVPPVKQPVSLLLQPSTGWFPCWDTGRGGIGVDRKFLPSCHPVATGHFVWEPCSSVCKDRLHWAELHFISNARRKLFSFFGKHVIS